MLLIMEKQQQTTLITGATSGLGYAYAKLCAKLGHRLILTGRNTEKLAELKRDLPTEVITLACDFSQRENYKNLASQIIEQNLIPDIFINNAGFGGMGSFTERDFNDDAHMLEVNIAALTYFCRIFAPYMKAKSHPTYILNVASAAAFVSGAYQAVYYASKAYVLSYSLGIRDELKSENSSLSISCFCPGRLSSDFHNRIGAKLTEKVLDCDKAALLSYKALMDKKAVYIAPLKVYILVTLSRILPRKVVSWYVLRKNKHFLKTNQQ